DNSRVYSQATMNSCRAAFKNCAPLHDKAFASLRYPDLQKTVDDCPLKHASLELIVSLFHQMYEYAMIYELVDKDYSAAVKIKIRDDDEHGEPFSEDELKILWAHRHDPVVGMLLIMCYSGYRIAAYKTLQVNFEEQYFQGGIKTAAGKNRIVPIHSGILPLVTHQMRNKGFLMRDAGAFRSKMYATLKLVGIKKHTPHDCRHTFSALCEKYGVNENDRKRMLGHSFGSDITNGVYGHRSVDDLRAEIEKIPVPPDCC
ncbi:integrase, partial [Lachnospiraceae bacterium 46-15]